MEQSTFFFHSRNGLPIGGIVTTLRCTGDAHEFDSDQQNHHLIMINILPVLFIIIIVVTILKMLTQFSFQQLDSKLPERLPSRTVVSSTGTSS